MSFRVRLAAEGDASEILRIYDPIVRNTAISFELDPPSAEEMRERIRNVLSSHVWLVCENEQKITGYAYATKFRPREAYQWAAEVTVYVDAAWQRRGIGTALYVSLLEALRLQGFSTAIAVIALPNEASVKLHERLGFRAVGVFERVGYKLERWHDVGWWQRKLRQADAHPEAPRPIGELVATPGWLDRRVVESWSGGVPQGALAQN
jgi:L-amino acid N-acyltransferase YncA